MTLVLLAINLLGLLLGMGIKVRLDQAMASQVWMDRFSKFKVFHLNKTISDHNRAEKRVNG